MTGFFGKNTIIVYFRKKNQSFRFYFTLMNILEVNSPKLVDYFHKVPYRIYKKDPHWIPHIRQDVEAVFDKKKNKFFSHGEAIRWVMLNDNGDLIGRVAAFINTKLANSFKQPTGGLGFFECLHDERAAFSLFDTSRQWLEARGIKAMDGPINFGEKDKYWGLITENFTHPPYYGQNYNPRYYVDFFENYGFQVYYNQLVFHRKIQDPLQDRFVERAKRITNNPSYKIISIQKKNLAKFAEDFRTIYNRAWVTHDNFRGMSQQQAKSLINKMRPILDEDLTWFAYHDDKPVAFYICLPEINEIMRHVNGNLNWWGKTKFLIHKLNGTCKTCFGIAFGIDPDFQGRGVEGAIFNELGKRIQPTMKYQDLIITWIGDFNPKMIHLIEGLGAKVIRKMATYRKLFDENAVFERCPIITGKD